MRALFLILLVMVHFAYSAGLEGLNPDSSLNRSRISKAYFEGDFDLVVSTLEEFRKLHPNPTREDKIYVYKYLSVIYASKEETRAKAESFSIRKAPKKAARKLKPNGAGQRGYG